MVHRAEREVQLPEAVIAKLLRIAEEDTDVISISVGEPDFPAPQPIVELTKEFADKCNHYSPPGGRQELKEEICKKLKNDNKVEAHPQNIVVTTGSQEGFLLAAASVLDVSEQAIIPTPGFLGYLPALEMLNVFPVALEVREDESWEINPDRVRRLIDPKKTKAIIINTPSNPTGTVLGRKILEDLADIARDYNVYILADEAYEKLVYDKQHISIGSLNGMHDHVITFYTFSKTYAMCGYRVGYAVGPRNSIAAMTKMHTYTTLSAPTISQLVATKALAIDKKYIEHMRLEYDRRRKFIVRHLNEMGLTTIMPHGAFYTFSNIKDLGFDDSMKFAFELLKEAKVAVMPGREFGVYGEGYIRCSYATALPKIKKAMERLGQFVRKHKK